MKGTRVVITALTPKGKFVLNEQMLKDVSKREEFRLASSVERKSVYSRGERNWFKSVSLWIPKVNPVRWELLGFKRMGMAEKHSFYMIVRKEFFSDGCGLNDFEVKFNDE